MMSAAKATISCPAQDTLLPRDTRRALPIALLRAREAVMARFRPILQARDVTEQQWRVIRVLGEESPLDASEVADRACVLAPSLTRIIKALEERALIIAPARCRRRPQDQPGDRAGRNGLDPRRDAGHPGWSTPSSKTAMVASASSTCSTCWASWRN